MWARASAEKFSGGGEGVRQRKKTEKQQKRPKNSTIKPLSWGGGSTYYICTMYENPRGPWPLPPAADAHVCVGGVGSDCWSLTAQGAL